MHHDLPQPMTFRSRRIRPARPQPPRLPRYVAVGLAGFFAIVPASAGGDDAKRGIDAKEHAEDAHEAAA